MKLRTEIEPLPHRGLIDHSTRVVAVGSCFVDEVGHRLESEMFDIDVNPLGTLYNPMSMADELSAALNGRGFDAADLFEDGGVWRTFRRHSRFSCADRDAMLTGLNDAQSRLRQRLLTADALIATFGSAIGFRLKASGAVVANCHKAPATMFERTKLSVNEITARWRELIAELRAANPRIKVILTVSPVRHIGYGLVADRESKSALIVACNELADSLEDVIYFPSYEIVVDDLRDYRFYADDLVHPSPLAVDYVHDIFCRSFMTEHTMQRAREWGKLSKRLTHRYSDTTRRAEGVAAAIAEARTLAARCADTAAAGSTQPDGPLERFIAAAKTEIITDKI